MRPFIDNDQKKRLTDLIHLSDETFDRISKNNHGMAAMIETAWAHAGQVFCQAFRDELEPYSKELATLADNLYVNWSSILDTPQQGEQLCLPLNEPK